MAAKKGRKHSVAGRILLWANILATLLLLASYTAPYISPARFWFPSFLGLTYPYLLILNLTFVLIWVIAWRSAAWLSVIAVIMGFASLPGVIHLPFLNGKRDTTATIKMITYNVHSLYGITNKKTPKGLRTQLHDFLQKENPDILCLQEFYVKSDDSTRFLTMFAGKLGLPYLFHKNYYETRDPRKINAIVTMSRYPVVGNGSFRMTNRNVFAIYTDLLINDDTVRVYNLHLESIRFGNEDYSFYSHLKEAETEKFDLSVSSLKIFGKLKKAFILRAQQADILKESIWNSPYPVIVCGDFNDTPYSYTFRTVAGDRKDAFRAASPDYFGTTYAGNLPSFRIDYILADPEFEIRNYQKYPIPLSDHYPVSARLNLNRQAR